MPGLIDHQYDKIAPGYGILVNYAILKSTILNGFVDSVDCVDGRELSFKNLEKPAGRTKVISGNVRTEKIILETLDGRTKDLG